MPWPCSRTEDAGGRNARLRTRVAGSQGVEGFHGQAGGQLSETGDVLPVTEPGQEGGRPLTPLGMIFWQIEEGYPYAGDGN